MSKRDYLPFPSPDDPNVMLVPLTKGLFAKIDADDYDIVAPYMWCASMCWRKEGRELWYAVRSAKNPPRTIYLHRAILGVERGELVDHEDGNGLDCRRSNLRKCIHGQNQANRRSKLGGTSQYLGVSWQTSANKWRVDIEKNGRHSYLGLFADEIEAAIAYDAAARELHGEFARCNFIS